jgi:anthranilate phosphoribosyltransferase
MGRERHLIPITNSALASELGKKGGSVSSPAKKLAAKLRELKKKGLTNENYKRVYELMTDSNMSDLDILLFLESMRAKATTISEKEKVARLLLEWRKLRFGTKLDITSQNLNIDIGMELSTDEIQELIQRNRAIQERDA